MGADVAITPALFRRSNGASARQLHRLSLTLLAYLSAAALLAVGPGVQSSPLWAWGALLLFCGFCLSLLRVAPATFLFFAPLLALRITEFASGVAIESGAYMIETAAFGRPTGAFTHLLLVYILFFGCAAFVTEWAWRRLRPNIAEAPMLWSRHAPLLWRVLLLVVGTASVVLLGTGLLHGFPLLNGADRFVYAAAVESPLYRSILLNRIVIVPFLGLLFAVRGYRLRALLMLLWILALSVLFAEKFTSLLMILSSVVIPAALVHVARGRPIPLRAVAALGAAVLVITVPAVLLAYGAADDLDGAITRYADRAALQGQLWFRADADYLAPLTLDEDALAADLRSWFQPSQQVSTLAGTRFGLYYVMAPFTPPRLLGWAMATGNGFVFALYPYLLMTTGVFGMLLLSSLLALYHAWMMRLLVTALARGAWLPALAFSRILSSFYGCYSGGYLWNIFGVKTLLTLALGLLLLALSRRRGRERKSPLQPIATAS